jgi:RNA polymerase sigma-70 factor (ECF subfamily)
MPLGEHVERVLEAGAAAFPAITAPRSELHRLISRRLEDEEGRAAIDSEEVYLAAACTLRDLAAVDAFEQGYVEPVPAVLSRLALTGDEIVLVMQLLRTRLYSGSRRSKSVTLHSGSGTARAAAAYAVDPTPSATPDPAAPADLPRVIAYAGLGQLGSLVRMTAIREALRLLRERGRLSSELVDGLEQVPVATTNPDLVSLASAHHLAFRAAFEQAIAELDVQQRNLLALAIVRGVGLDRIGTIYSVHRETAARWVTSARLNLTRSVHVILERTIDSPHSADDLLPLVEAQLELSLGTLSTFEPSSPVGEP